MSPRMPGEFAPHERTVICWPTRERIYPGPLLEEARRAHAELARAIARFEPVTMIARPEQADAAVEQCGPAVDVVAIEIDDSWFRDSGPIYVEDGGERFAIDFVFNAWGEKFPPWSDDAAVARADLVEEILQTIKLLPGEEVVGVNNVFGKRRERLLPPIAAGAGLWRAPGFFERARQIFDW